MMQANNIIFHHFAGTSDCNAIPLGDFKIHVCRPDLMCNYNHNIINTKINALHNMYPLGVKTESHYFYNESRSNAVSTHNIN